eukprot:366337-Chlamydomonas_euryale.AAC.20
MVVVHAQRPYEQRDRCMLSMHASDGLSACAKKVHARDETCAPGKSSKYAQCHAQLPVTRMSCTTTHNPLPVCHACLPMQQQTHPNEILCA